MQKVTIQPGQAGQRFDKFLGRHLCGTGMSFIYKMLRKKNITLNGRKSDGKELLKAGDEVSFFFSDETYEKFTHVDSISQSNQGLKINAYTEAYNMLKGIEILYEDQDVLFLNKPSGILSQKASDADISANEWMIGYLLKKGEISSESLAGFKPSVCNRLDRNTSGILLCGKSLVGSRELNRLIKEREVRKFYQLFVKGNLEKEETLEGFLTKDERRNKVTLSTKKTEGSTYIKTSYKPLAHNVLQENPSGKSQNSLKGRKITFLEVELFTGKTHQIRAHLSSIGYPLVGDYKYGDAAFNAYFKNKYGVKSQLLHAVRMEFPEKCEALPKLSGMALKSPLPGVFEKIIKDENIK
mgnify:CR=1 FL=1